MHTRFIDDGGTAAALAVVGLDGRRTRVRQDPQAGRAAEPVRGQRQGRHRRARARRLRPARGRRDPAEGQVLHRRHAVAGRGAAEKGATVTAPFGAAQALAAAVAAPLAHADARLQRLPALEPDAGAVPGDLLDAARQPQDLVPPLAGDNPDVVKEEVIGKSVLGPGRSWPTRSPKDARGERDGGRPAVLYDSTQHAREWIATEVERRLFKYVRRTTSTRAATPASSSCSDPRAVVRPGRQPRRLRLHVRRQGHAAVAQEPARRRRHGGFTRTTTASTPTATSRQVELRPRGRVGRPGRRDLPRRRPGLRARGPGDARARAAHRVQVPDRLPLVRPADPLPRGLAGRDAGHRRAADGGARRRRRQPRGRRASTPTSRRSSTRPTATSPTTRCAASARRPTPSSSTAAPAPDVGGTVDGPDSFSPGGFVFQDSEADVQAEFQKNLAFALDLARSARRPGRTRARTWATRRRTSCRRRSRSPTAIRRPSRSTPRSRSARCRVYWQVNGGARRTRRRPREYQGGQRRYCDPGTYYHHMRGAGRPAPARATA